jgi:hypothetical protein
VFPKLELTEIALRRSIDLHQRRAHLFSLSRYYISSAGWRFYFLSSWLN